MLNLLNQVVIASLAKQTQSSGTPTEAGASLERWRGEKCESQRPLVATFFFFLQTPINNDVIFSYDPINSFKWETFALMQNGKTLL